MYFAKEIHPQRRALADFNIPLVRVDLRFPLYQMIQPGYLWVNQSVLAFLGILILVHEFPYQQVRLWKIIIKKMEYNYR